MKTFKLYIGGDLSFITKAATKELAESKFARLICINEGMNFNDYGTLKGIIKDAYGEETFEIKK